MSSSRGLQRDRLSTELALLPAVSLRVSAPLLSMSRVQPVCG
jgi:hypothetical protein